MLPLEQKRAHMRHFLIRPRDGSIAPVEVLAQDESEVLLVMERMKCREVDVDRDGLFVFTAILVDTGLWQIVGRAGQAGDQYHQPRQQNAH